MEKKIFDNAFDKAKNAFEVAYKKTGEIVSLEKLKFNLSSLKSKRSKLFAELGQEYYLKIRNSDDLADIQNNLVVSIAELDERIEDISNQIAYAKSKRICPKCGSAIDEKSIFCSYCGGKVTFDSENADE